MSWIGPRSVDGGLDLVELPEVAGSIWLCGKHLAGPGPEAALARADGADLIVCFCEPFELAERYPDYVHWLAEHADTRALWRPIPDLTAPTLAEASAIGEELVEHVIAGRSLVMHCAAGKGRAPTMAITTMVMVGIELSQALERVAQARPGAGPEVGAQRELVEAIARTHSPPGG